MSDLDQKEQNHVRAALRYLRGRLGGWGAVGAGLHCVPKSLEPIASGRSKVSASMAIRVARLAGVMIDDLLVGKFLPPGACPNCGYVPVPGFPDEQMLVDDAPPRPGNGLALVR